jgi:hypothetical protein
MPQSVIPCTWAQLLETGLLHADPHPGNLLRTADGKICILDFGLMTEVEPERRLALVEYIAHLSVQDWRGVAKDLVNLGFAPKGALAHCLSTPTPISFLTIPLKGCCPLTHGARALSCHASRQRLAPHGSSCCAHAFLDGSLQAGVK